MACGASLVEIISRIILLFQSGHHVGLRKQATVNVGIGCAVAGKIWRADLLEAHPGAEALPEFGFTGHRVHFINFGLRIASLARDRKQRFAVRRPAEECKVRINSPDHANPAAVEWPDSRTVRSSHR